VRFEELREAFDWAVSRAVSARDLRRPLSGLAERAAILMGINGEAEWRTIPGFVWAPPEPLPWGDARGLLIGTRESGKV
jgi:hypothetical protein